MVHLSGELKKKGFCVLRWEAQPSHLDQPAQLPPQCAGSTSGADRSMAPSPIDAGSSGSGQIDQAGDRLREVLISLEDGLKYQLISRQYDD